MANCTLHADANTGHAFGIFMASVGTLRTFGAPAPVNSALEVVPSQRLFMLYRAGLSFVPHPLVLSVFGTWCSFFFWVRHSTIAVLSARGYHALLLHHFCYA